MNKIRFNTYEEMQELKAKKLVTSRVNGNLTTFKYARKVMYDYLWDTDQRFLEARGHTYDNRNGQLVQATPRKSFNYLENNWWREAKPDTLVQLYKKYNGFMACATIFEGKLLVSTTGTTTSEFADIAKREITKFKATHHSSSMLHEIEHRASSLFEIVVPEDPHIVFEAKQGAVPLGWRYKDDGMFIPHGDYKEMTLADAIEFTQKDRGEGFMVYNLEEEDSIVRYNTPCKMKTPYYVGKKKLMRMTARNVEFMYDRPDFYAEANLPAMWSGIPEIITKDFTMQEWLALDSQQRRGIIEGYIGV